MSADALKSASITNLDTVPALANTAGIGAAGYTQEISDYVSATAGGLADTGSKYKMVRVPTTVKLKEIWIESVADRDTDNSPTLALDLGVYYSDSTLDGTKASLQGTAVDVDILMANVAFADSAANRKINGLASLDVDKRNQPMWQAIGLSSDPGGMFDIVMAVHAAAATAAAGKIGISVRFVA